MTKKISQFNFKGQEEGRKCSHNTKFGAGHQNCLGMYYSISDGFLLIIPLHWGYMEGPRTVW